MVIVRTSRLSHPTVSCRHANRPGADPPLELLVIATAADATVLHLCTTARPGPRSGGLRGGTEDVGAEQTCLHRGAAASGETQCPGEGPASLRCAQALRGGVHRCSPAG